MRALMWILRWIAYSGWRVTMVIASFIFVYHAISELLVIRGRPLNFHQRIELTARDVKFAVRGPRPPAEWRVAIAAADEKALREFGRLPWPRDVHARLVDALTKQGAGAIAFDMTFDDRVVDSSAEVAAKIRARAEQAGVFDASA